VSTKDDIFKIRVLSFMLDGTVLSLSDMSIIANNSMGVLKRGSLADISQKMVL